MPIDGDEDLVVYEGCMFGFGGMYCDSGAQPFERFALLHQPLTRVSAPRAAPAHRGAPQAAALTALRGQFPWLTEAETLGALAGGSRVKGKLDEKG